MIQKGYVYHLTCDAPECGANASVPVPRHGLDIKRKVKQAAMEKGWFPILNAAFECPECRKKREGSLEEK